ncbi:MAG: P-loop NTPase [Candidatus Nanoarchaeia archaeon]|jgi:septum site-determining protein MinD
MTHVIGVFSGKGGVGKTTIATNMGASLAWDYGNNVVAIDANTTSSNLGLNFGSYRFPVTLNDVLKGKADITEAIYAHPSGLKIIPSSTFNEDIDANPAKMKEIINYLKEYVDYLVLDCPPTLGVETTSMINLVDEAVIVTNPDWAALLEAKRTIDFIKSQKKNVVGVVINKAELEPEEIEKVKKALNIPVLGVIPFDESVLKSVDKRVPFIHLYNRSRPSRAFKKFMEELTGQTFPNRGILERVIGWFD